MLKFKKLFTMGLMASLAGLFAVGCTEDEPVDGVFSNVTVVSEGVGAGANLAGGTSNSWVKSLSDVESGTTVYIVPGTSSKEFTSWSSSPRVTVSGPDAQGRYSFTMPAQNITVTANFEEEEVISTVTVVSEGLGSGAAIPGVQDNCVTPTFAALGDTVYLCHGEVEDKVFVKWNSSVTGVNFSLDIYEGLYYFIMPGSDITVTAVFEDIVTSTVTVVSEGLGSGAAVPGVQDDCVKTSFAETGDIVVLCPGEVEGKVFDGWTTVPTNLIIYGPDDDGQYFFIMPSSDVTVTANFSYSTGKASLRLSWEAAAQTPHINTISASPTDVDYWKTVVYLGNDYVDENATDIPLYSGNPALPDNFYKKGEPTENKSKYFTTEDGNYTAVLEGNDEYGEFDIVANYTITVNPGTATAAGADKWFDVGFDVLTFLDEEFGGNENAWFLQENDDGDTPSFLQKRVKQGRVKTFTSKKVTAAGSIDITYYFMRRANKS